MADMDLREVLAHTLHENIGSGHTHSFHDEDGRLVEATPQCELAADAIFARLSQPDVLDEFERRVKERYDHGPEGEWTGPTARRVLADMLGGES